jgi:hypothetical protein
MSICVILIVCWHDYMTIGKVVHCKRRMMPIFASRKTQISLFPGEGFLNSSIFQTMLASA